MGRVKGEPNMQHGDPMFGVIFVGMIVGMYMLPTIVAYRRHHHNRGTITLLNIFLGWTFLGWVIAISMAASGVRRDVA